MSLISTANAKSYTDRIAAAWIQLLAAAGTKTGNPASGNVRGTINNLLTDVVALNNYEQEADLSTHVSNALAAATAERMAATFAAEPLTALDAHCAARGPAVNAAVVGLSTFLTYYNGTGGSAFAALMTPEIQYLWKQLVDPSGLPRAGIMSPAIHPTFVSTASVHGMGDKVVAGAFTVGDAVDTTQYSEVIPVLEVTTNITGGSGIIQAAIVGVDDLGAVCTWAAVTLTGGNNPVSALSGITITPAVNVASRQTVAFSSATGIVIGSVLTINSGLVDQEVIVVENVSGSNITAVFRLAHLAGATVTGKTCTAAGTPSTGAGRRCRSVTGITYTLNSQSAGVVRVIGAQDRAAV